jgi:enoyl-CoA hydratase/carnithine racemase
MSPKHFQWRVEDRVGVVTLNRPERKNPLTFDSYAELRDFFGNLKNEQNVRAVVMTGAGGNFCSGGDVHEIIGPLTRMKLPQLLEFTRMTGDLVKAMRHCPQPVIAAVEGVCAGAGAILAMASDLRYAAPSAKVAFLFVRVGLAGCDMGACAILPRIIGQGRAAELLYTGRSMSAEEGHGWGFFNRVSDSPLDAALITAKELAAGPTAAHAVTKKMLHQEWNVTVDQAIDMEAVAQAELMQTKDFQRAYEAFAAKRKPVFQGD